MKRAARLLDENALDALALRYVERFATTRARLAVYLARKIRERGWAGEREPDPAAVAERLAALGYIDDRSFGEARAAAMARRGLGGRRVSAALRMAGLDEADAASLAPEIAERAVSAAIGFARRRRIGPFAAEQADPLTREKHIAAMLRAGHDAALARRIVAMAPGEDVTKLDSYG